ncbi:MAG: porin family protein [Ruminococcus flavefaciens]|nr:porin family protein [Ruminococcus flavefaciens]
MKKFLLGAALMLASVAASAQVYMGGSVAFDRNTSDNETRFIIAPEVGYNLNAKWAVGATIDYTHDFEQGQSTDLVSLAPYARYSFYKHQKVRLFVDGGISLGVGKSRFDETMVVCKIGFKPGVAFDINEKFGLVAHMGFLGYQGSNGEAKEYDINGKTKYPDKFGFDFSSLNLSLGFCYNF